MSEWRIISLPRWWEVAYAAGAPAIGCGQVEMAIHDRSRHARLRRVGAGREARLDQIGFMRDNTSATR
jgi:hypothetical protein